MAQKSWPVTQELSYLDARQRPITADHSKARPYIRPLVEHGSSENYRLGEDKRVSLRPSTLVLMKRTRDFLARPYEARTRIEYKVDGVDCSIRMRKTHRKNVFVPGEYLDLELINFEPSGQGMFTEYLTQLERTNMFPLIGLWIDDILSPSFADFFLNRGYVKVTEKHNKTSAYRLIGRTPT